MRENYFEGDILVVEGIDGSGTSSQAERLAQLENTVYTAEPGQRREEKSLIGQKIEQMITHGDYSAHAVALSFAADRMTHLEEKVIPLLKEGKNVVFDRYYHSSLVYQNIMGAGFPWLKEINKRAIRPDICFILDVSAEIGMERISARGGDENIFENVSFQRRASRGYLELDQKLDENIIYIEGTKNKEEVSQDILDRAEDELCGLKR